MSHKIIIRPINEPINPALINPMVGLPVETEIAIIEKGANHLGEIKLLSKIAEPNY